MRSINFLELQIFSCRFAVEYRLPAGITFAPHSHINNTGLFEYIPDHRTPVAVCFGNRLSTPSHSSPFQGHCPNNWSNFANGSFETSNATLPWDRSPEQPKLWYSELQPMSSTENQMLSKTAVHPISEVRWRPA